MIMNLPYASIGDQTKPEQTLLINEGIQASRSHRTDHDRLPFSEEDARARTEAFYLTRMVVPLVNAVWTVALLLLPSKQREGDRHAVNEHSEARH